MKSLMRKIIAKEKSLNRYLRSGKYLFDIGNKLKYGIGAPVYGARVWVRPEKVDRAIMQEPLIKLHPKEIDSTWMIYDRRCSGTVMDFTGITPINYCHVLDVTIVRGCIERWGNGRKWEDTDIYEYTLKMIELSKEKKFNGCKTIDDIVTKYIGYDKMFQQVANENRLRTRSELGGFRELGGILVHIGLNGEILLGTNGHHRFAMAKVLDIEFPAKIGCVHEKCLNNFKNISK